ncbi:MAG: extracellular solute-binding protein [Ardenticatenales bacterium]|nr:extracellular solute-binding protein [Ardenticatenales bacterium]
MWRDTGLRTIICLLVVGLLLACTGATPALPPTPEPETSGEKVTLRFLWYSDGGEGEVMRDLLDRYETVNSQVQVELITVPYAELHDTLDAQLASEESVDLARITDAGRFRGKYLDLRPYLSNPDGWVTNWPAAVLQSMRTADDPAALYGFPSQFTLTGPFINRTLFEQAGVDVPSDKGEDISWAKWVAALQEVAHKTDTPYALAIDRSGHRFWSLSLSECAHYVNSTTGEFIVDSPGFRKVAQQMVIWHQVGVMPPEVWVGKDGEYADAGTLFIEGKVPFYLGGSWRIGQFADEIGDRFVWDAVPTPVGECNGTAIPGGALIVALAETEHPAEVAALVDYLSEERIIAEFSERSLFLPAHLGLISKGLTYPRHNEVLNTFMAEIPNLQSEAYILQYHPRSFALNTAIRDEISAVLAREITLDQGIKNIQERLRETEE